MRNWLAAIGSFVAGTGLGYMIAEVAVDARLRKQYEESAAARLRAFELAEQYQARGEVPEVDPNLEDPFVLDLKSAALPAPDGVNEFSGKIDYNPLEKNPYHTPPKIVDDVGEEVDMVAISYITEEDYIEADGRAKEQLTFVGDGNTVHFFEDGVQIEDWQDRLGESFLVDFRKLVPYGATPTVWVRNEKTDTDYEVIQEIP